MNPDYKHVIQRLRKGLGAQGFRQVANLFIRLAEVPLFLSFWGAERYGEWLMVAAIPSYLAMADGGFTGTTQHEMAMRSGAGDRTGALAAFQSTWVLLLILSAVLMGLTFLATTLLPLDHWLKLKSMDGEALTIVILLLAGHVVLNFQSGLVYGGYSCEGRYARGIILWTWMHLFDFAGLALAIVLGGGPVAAATGFLAGRALGLLLFLVDLPRVAPWLSYGWSHASQAQMVRLLRPSLATMAFPLGDALNVQGMRLVIGVILGPVAVAVFSSMRTLCRSAMKPISVVALLIEPEMALAYGADNRALIKELFLRSSQVTVWLVLPACLLLWLFGEQIFQIWTRGEIALDAPLYLWLLLASAANSLWYIALMVPYATNRHGRVAVFSVAANSGMLLIAGFFMTWIGLPGSGIAVLFAELAMAVWVLPIAFSQSAVDVKIWLGRITSPPQLRPLLLRRNSQHKH